MKYDLKQMLLNEIEVRATKQENDGGTFRDKMGKIAGYNDWSGLYRFLTDQIKDIKDFNGLLNVVRSLFLDIKKELMSDFILSLDPNKKGARCGLEYLVHNRLYDSADKLIEKMKKCSNVESREWGKMYELERMVVRGELSYFDTVELINQIKPKTEEMSIYGQMMYVHGYYLKGKFNLIFELYDSIEDRIKNISDDYIRRIYLCRNALIMIAVHMHKGNTEAARRYIQIILDNSTQEGFRSLAYLQLGNTYIFESYDLGYKALQQALLYGYRLGSEIRIQNIKRSINFLQNYWGKTPEYLDHESSNISDIHEIAFSLIRQNKKEEAKQLLDTIDKSKLTDYSLGFHYFYQGLLSNSKSDYYKSVGCFMKSGDKFYRKLPLLELDKLGYDQEALEIMAI